MKNKKKRFKEGKQPEAATLQWIADQLDRFQNIRSEDLIISTGNGFVTIGENKKDCLYVALDSGGNGGHSWHEVTPGASGTFTTTPGGRSATTSDGPAFELNNKSVASGKVVKICPGYEEEWLFEYIASGCSANITGGAACGDGGPGTVSISVTWELLASDGTTVLATSTGTSCNFTGLNGTSTYYLRISKTGYWTKTSSPITPGCGSTASIPMYTWPSSMSASVTVNLNGLCGVSGASVTISGNISGSGTTNSSGVASFTITTSSTLYTQTYSMSVTPPAGTGASSYSASGLTFGPCVSSFGAIVTLPNDSSHDGNTCGNKYLPKIFSYSDDYGSCTLSSSGFGSWTGTYDYSSSQCGNTTTTCFPTPPQTTMCQAYQSGTPHISITLVLPTGSCTSPTMTITRSAVYGILAPTCNPFSGTYVPMVIDQYSSDCTGGTILYDAEPYTSFSLSCPTTAVSYSGSISAFVDPITSTSVPETGVSFTISGTI